MLLVLASACSVGNVYYSQPLLGEMATEFRRTPAAIGLVTTLTQLGYVLGLIFVAPLGDVVEKRRLLTGLFLLAAVALLASAVCHSFGGFLALAIAVGLTAVPAQVIIPYVAGRSTARGQAKNLGLVLSSALLGILLSRTASGFLGSHLGWRAVYWVAGALMVALAGLVRALPPDPPEARIGYGALIASLGSLARELPGLRSIAVTGALVYAAFCAFWASLAFYLQSPAHGLGPGTAGAFGLVGAAGALASNFTGRALGRVGAARVVRLSLAALLAAYATMYLAGASLAGLVAGVLLLDVGAQAASIANQSEIYRRYAHARTRLNTIYKIFYFVGGAAGSALSAVAWQHAGWGGVCGLGAALAAVAALQFGARGGEGRSLT